MFEPYILYLIPKITVNQNKQSLKFLRSVYGIGFYRSHKFLVFYGPTKNYNVHVKKLTGRFFKRIQLLSFRWHLPLGIYLKRKQGLVRRFLINIKSRRGLRRFYGLPSRGQRSHSNAATSRKRLDLKKKLIKVQKKKKF